MKYQCEICEEEYNGEKKFKEHLVEERENIMTEIDSFDIDLSYIESELKNN